MTKQLYIMHNILMISDAYVDPASGNMFYFHSFSFSILPSLLHPDPVSYYNPLHIAILRGRPSMVRLLAGHGADIEKRDRVS